MKLFGYSISLNVIILIGILYLIMIVNALTGACNMEGLKGKKHKNNKGARDAALGAVHQAKSTVAKTKRELDNIQRSTAAPDLKILLLKDLKDALLNLVTKLKTAADILDDDNYDKKIASFIKGPIGSLISLIDEQVKAQQAQTKAKSR